MAKSSQDELDHELHNALSSMGVAVKHMARLISITYKEYERFKKASKDLEKCRKCMKVKE